MEDLERFVGEHSGEHFLLNGFHGKNANPYTTGRSPVWLTGYSPSPSSFSLWMAGGREVLAPLGVFGRLDSTWIETGWNPDGNMLFCFVLNLPKHR